MAEVVAYGVALLVLYGLVKLVDLFWLRVREIQRHFKGQGLVGPCYKPIIGSLGCFGELYLKAQRNQPKQTPSDVRPSHDIIPHVFPHLLLWKKMYGNVYLYWFGRSPRVVINDPELIKDFTNNPTSYSQWKENPLMENLAGKSTLALGGETWAMHRKLINPLFRMDSLKEVSGIILSATKEKIKGWNDLVGSSEIEIEMHAELEKLGQYIIAKVLFGVDVDEGLHAVMMQTQQAALCSQALKDFYIPGSRFLPTRLNRKSKWLRREVKRRVKELIRRKREKRDARGHDGWLSLMLSSNAMSDEQVVDECCAMSLAGSESTALLMTWACVLLGAHTEWQALARREIDEVLNGSPLTMESLSRLKLVDKIIKETLRLYPPVPILAKRADKETTIGRLRIPAGTFVEVAPIAVHHDRQQWGDTVHEFDPSRFSGGVSKASLHPMAFMPFMKGQRICVGANFAVAEATMALAMILREFEWVLSPKYVHAPAYAITLKPGEGAPLLLRKINH